MLLRNDDQLESDFISWRDISPLSCLWTPLVVRGERSRTLKLREKNLWIEGLNNFFILRSKSLKMTCHKDITLNFAWTEGILWTCPGWGENDTQTHRTFKLFMRCSSIWDNSRQLPSWNNRQSKHTWIIVRIARIQWFRVFSSVGISWNNLVSWKYLT